jgi:hypothetical protein
MNLALDRLRAHLIKMPCHVEHRVAETLRYVNRDEVLAYLDAEIAADQAADSAMAKFAAGSGFATGTTYDPET